MLRKKRWVSSAQISFHLPTPCTHLACRGKIQATHHRLPGKKKKQPPPPLPAAMFPTRQPPIPKVRVTAAGHRLHTYGTCLDGRRLHTYGTCLDGHRLHTYGTCLDGHRLHTYCACLALGLLRMCCRPLLPLPLARRCSTRGDCAGALCQGGPAACSRLASGHACTAVAAGGGGHLPACKQPEHSALCAPVAWSSSFYAAFGTELVRCSPCVHCSPRPPSRIIRAPPPSPPSLPARSRSTSR